MIIIIIIIIVNIVIVIVTVIVLAGVTNYMKSADPERARNVSDEEAALSASACARWTLVAYLRILRNDLRPLP